MTITGRAMTITGRGSLALAVAAGLLAFGALPASAQGAHVAEASGPFTPNPGFVANATDPSVNPAIGAEGRVHLVVGADGRTIATLHVSGLPAGRSFASHLHRDPCSTSFGGPHYQAPTGTPAGNADPDHEVWLDFTTNAAGNARSHAVVPFEVSPGARSVVIHQGDATGPGGVVVPSQRLACLDVTV
jgi:Cu-Zn family superoxide dismutase